jgi:large subunit ribosomal protein L6
MSRIGKLPVTIPAGVTVELKDGVLTVKGAKGTLTRAVVGAIDIKVEGNTASVVTLNQERETQAKHGLYRALLAGMVKGVTEGYTKTLEIQGVGWKVEKNGKGLTMSVGFSHKVPVEAVEGITFDCPTPTEITVSGIDKELVGQVAANIRAVREPEPYHGYGIRYKGEAVEHKEGKTSGGKGKK